MAEILDIVKEKLTPLKDSVNVQYTQITNYHCLVVPVQNLKDICEIIKSQADFDQLIDAAGVDRFTKNDRFEVIYNLWSNKHKARIFVRVKLDSKKPEVDSLCSIWPSANWYEREAYDMFGITFLNHPDLRRIYMMEEFQYYPLRKDYPLMGIPGAVELPKK